MFKIFTSALTLMISLQVHAGLSSSALGFKTSKPTDTRTPLSPLTLTTIKPTGTPLATFEPANPRLVITNQKPVFTKEEEEKIRKAVRNYELEKAKGMHDLPRELVWLDSQCKGEACKPLRKYLVSLPEPTKNRLAEALRKANMASKQGLFESARLVKMVEHILQADKTDEFKAHLLEELAEGFDVEYQTVEIEGRKVKLERVNNMVFMDHDMFIGDIPNKDTIRRSFFFLPGFPWWFTEEMWKAIARIMQGNIDYWPVKFSDGGRRVNVPYKIATDLSSAKEDDVAEALARMCLETALPLPDWMEGENFARDLITALTTYAMKQGDKSCRQLIAGVNDALGDNMGDDFVLNLIPRSTQVSYINFRAHASRCSSPVGMGSSGPNNVNVADWCGVGSLMHETLHSLGFYHQQSRQNRDNHIDVMWANIQDDKEHNYQKRSFLVGGTSYDYFSLLHYSRINGFSIGGAPTMNATPFGVPAGPTYDLLQATYNGAMGQREGMSPADLDALHGVY